MIIIPLVAVLLVGSLQVIYQLWQTSSAIGYTVTKGSAHLVYNTVLKNAAESMQKNKCFNASNFLNISTAATPTYSVTTKSNLKNCLAPLLEVNWLDTVKVDITRVVGDSDKELAQGAVKVTQSYLTKPTTNAPQMEINDTRFLRFKVATMAEFALGFRGNTGTRINLINNSGLRVMGWSYVHGSQPLVFDTFVNPTATTSGMVLNFSDPMLVRAKVLTLSSKITSASMLQFNHHFKGGIHLAEVEDLLTFPIDDNPPAWDQNVDYYYVYNETMGYPLPANINSAHGDAGYRPVNAARASVTSFPDGTVISKLSDTCGNPGDLHRGDAKPMILYRSGKSVSLDMKNDAAFCGMIVADSLTINTTPGKKHLLIGSYWVNTLKVTGGGEVIIFNPLRYSQPPKNELSAASIDMSAVIRQLLVLRATSSYNFFLPLFKNKTGIVGFDPILLSSFFEPCGGAMCWKSVVNAFDWNTLYAQAGWQDKVLFFVEESL